MKKSNRRGYHKRAQIAAPTGPKGIKNLRPSFLLLRMGLKEAKKEGRSVYQTKRPHSALAGIPYTEGQRMNNPCTKKSQCSCGCLPGQAALPLVCSKEGLKSLPKEAGESEAEPAAALLSLKRAGYSYQLQARAFGLHPVHLSRLVHGKAKTNRYRAALIASCDPRRFNALVNLLGLQRKVRR